MYARESYQLQDNLLDLLPPLNLRRLDPYIFSQMSNSPNSENSRIYFMAS